MSYKQKMIACKICKKYVMGAVWKVHVLGKKHLHFTPKKIKVSGTYDSSRVDEVHAYFAQFGTIGSKKVIVEDDEVIIEYGFQDKRAHSKIIYKQHMLFDQLLKVTWDEVTQPISNPMFAKTQPRKNPGPINKAAKGNMPKKSRTDVENSKQAILDGLKDLQTFTEQVSMLHSRLQIDKLENEKKKKTIYDDLTAALTPMFALSKIYFFGSSVTGLDIQGSDLDVYVANVREDTRPEAATLKVIRHLIFKSHKFCDVLLISSAKIPIIKCIHTETQICCDLNIKNKLSVCNSQLIRYYLSLDDKLRSLMITIKFWADLYDLKKVNFFSSYALYMMVIFYLQHKPYRIPCVKHLQRVIAPDWVEGWNCAFELKGFGNQALKNESMLNLVTGFFRFYANFDYTSKIISPYFGRALDKTCFVKPYDLPDGCEEFINNNEDLIMNAGICIQDPFEHGRNVAASAPLSCIGKFVAMCRSSLKLMEEGEEQLLYKILTQPPQSDVHFVMEKPEDRDKTEWTQSINDIINKILTLIMNLQMVKTKDGYVCQGEHNIWDGRFNILKNLLSELPPESSNIDKEIAATNCIVKFLKPLLQFRFLMSVNFMQSPCRVEITLKPTSKKCKYFLHAAHFFLVRLHKYSQPQEEEEEVEDFSDKITATEPHLAVMTQKDDKIKKEDDGTSSGKEVLETSNGADKYTSNNVGETSELHRGKAEDDDEDIPADFFDDFSNQDFMDGLDIVDAWDEDKLVDANVDDDRQSSEKHRRPHSPIRFITSDRQLRKYGRSKSRSLTRRVKPSELHTRRRSRSRSHEKNRALERRDPEKTKRDIHRDKVKCAKDKEQKIVSDKLRIVETGLVPPGMEMEADLNSIMKENEKEKRRSTATSSSVEKARERERERERDRRYLRRSSSRERKPVRYSPGPVIYKPRPREREPVYRPRKQRTTSVDSNLSDRELWIRSSRKRSRSRSRDSPRRSKTKKYEEKKKKSFLEEIRDKLNETRTPLPPPAAVGFSMVPYPNAVPAPAPAPVPAPTHYFHPTPMNQALQQYDQSFFIGDAFQNVGMNQSQNVVLTSPQNVMNHPQSPFNLLHSPGNVIQPRPIPPMQTTPVALPTVKLTLGPVLKPQAMVSPKVNTPVLNEMLVKAKEEQKKETEDIGKLFADKKISLSDFLTITAKSEVQSSSPEHLQKKIKVISRCQDAIKAMSDDRKFNGRLSVRPCSDLKNKTDVKYQTPLRKIPVVRFQFTSPAKISEETDSFAAALDKILQNIGVLKETVDLEEVVETVSKLSNSSFADEETAALTLKANFLNQRKADAKSECEECKKRRSKSFVEVGSQCADKKETVTIAIQVNEEELNATKGFPKNDSIAYLTPAQLLEKEKEKEKEAEKTAAPLVAEKTVEKKSEAPVKVAPKKPLRPTFKTRGASRRGGRGRPKSNYYDYEYEQEYYNAERPMFEEPGESFGMGRYGGPSGPPAQRFPKPLYVEEEPRQLMRLHQFREDEDNFIDFVQPYRGRGRGGRFGGNIRY